MKCWFCDKDAKGACAACGRGLCVDHAHFHDELTISKSDTSTGYSSFYNVYNALKCSDCRLEWINSSRTARRINGTNDCRSPGPFR
jgi:hypothetical protein